MANTKIEFVDACVNPQSGCCKISAGCQHCYAASFTKRLCGMGQAKYQDGFDKVKYHPDALKELDKIQAGKKVFIGSMSDLFIFDTEEHFTTIDVILKSVQDHPQLTCLFLTKRPQHMRKYFMTREVPPNLWLGTTVEAPNYLWRVEKIRDLPASVRFLSIEPLLRDLGQVNLANIDWVIVGGETGVGARLMQKEWALSIQKQCLEQHVPFFFKTYGSGNPLEKGGLLNDVEYHEFPKPTAVNTANVNLKNNNIMAETETNREVAEAAAAQQIDEIENETQCYIPASRPLDQNDQTMEEPKVKQTNNPVMNEKNYKPTVATAAYPAAKEVQKINYIDRFLSDKYFPTIAANKLQERHSLSLDERLRGDVLSRCKNLGLIEQDGLPSGSLLAELDGVLSTSKIRPRITAQYLVSDLRKVGYKFGYTKENREVDKLHVSKLRSHVKGTSEKCFHETAKVCWAKDMVKTHQLCDLNGTPITADAENLDKYIIILDGQHRLACVIDEPEIDLYAEFVDVADETRYIEELNNYSKVWNGDDYTHCLQQKNPETQQLLTAIANFKAHYGVSNKFAEMALTHAVDKFKRADLKGYCEGAKVIDADKFAIDQEQIDLAYAIMDALLAKFDGDGSCKKLEMIESVIEVHKAMEDEFLPNAKRNLKEFIFLLDSSDKGAMTKAIDSKNQGDLRASWQKAWKMFTPKLTEADRKAMETEVDGKIKEWFEQHPAAVSNTPTAPKSNKGTLDSLFKGKIVKNHRVAKVKA